MRDIVSHAVSCSDYSLIMHSSDGDGLFRLLRKQWHILGIDCRVALRIVLFLLGAQFAAFRLTLFLARPLELLLMLFLCKLRNNVVGACLFSLRTIWWTGSLCRYLAACWRRRPGTCRGWLPPLRASLPTAVPEFHPYSWGPKRNRPWDGRSSRLCPDIWT